MKKTIIAVLTFTVFCPLVFAGVMLTLKCSNKQCNFRSEVWTDTGKLSTAVHGYCVECKKMVTASFEKNKSKPIARVWDSVTGTMHDLYECKECSKPFAEAKQIAFCPKCNMKTISTEVTGKWD